MKAEPELVQDVERRGFTVIEEGRLALSVRHVGQAAQDRPSQPVAGGAPFVTYVNCRGRGWGVRAPMVDGLGPGLAATPTGATLGRRAVR